MRIAQGADHLEFNDDPVLDQEVGGLFTNDHVVVKDNDSAMLDGAEPALAQLIGKRILVNLFNEPMTERIGNPECASDDPFSHWYQQQGIPFIHLHPADPP
jgi:hypothetical protein